MAFDSWGNLWVVSNFVGVVYEYASWQLAHSGSPTPVRTISDLPATPNGDGFDPWGDLWVSTAVSTQCPQGCVVEFSKYELARLHPKPTVIISSTGGANLSFTRSGDMWLVTGGGPASDCVYGDPCNNELVEFTRAQLSSIGFPRTYGDDQFGHPRVLDLRGSRCPLRQRVPLRPIWGRGRLRWGRLGLQLQHTHRHRVRQGPASRIGVSVTRP